MKKMDFVMIVLVLLIGISVFAAYFKKYNVDTDNAKIEIYYHDHLIDSIIFEENKNYTYTIETVDSKTLMITKNINGNITTFTREFNQPRHIKNKISIDGHKIEMIEANCDNKLCMKMKMSRTYTLPIICTNGIAIMFVPKGDLEGIA